MKKTKKQNHGLTVVLFIVIIVLIVLASVYYLNNQDRIGRRGDLVGDGVCGNLASEEGENYCCARMHKDDSHTACVGEWEYVEGIKLCQWVCQNTEPSCPEDARLCENGKIVERNASKECAFDSCD